jgi:hypothetical protein
VFELDFGVSSFGSLLGSFPLLSAADLAFIDVSAVQASQIPQTGLRWQGFKQEMMAGHGGVIGQMDVTVGMATQEEGVVRGEGEDFAFGSAMGDSKLNGCGHKTLFLASTGAVEKRQPPRQVLAKRCHQVLGTGFGFGGLGWPGKSIALPKFGEVFWADASMPPEVIA